MWTKKIAYSLNKRRSLAYYTIRKISNKIHSQQASITLFKMLDISMPL